MNINYLVPVSTYDNGNESASRYTVIFLADNWQDQMITKAYNDLGIESTAISEQPYKRISFQALPKAVQASIISHYNTQGV